jgi:hypothetical protein
VIAEPAPSAELSAIDSSGRGIRIRFLWQGGRYLHQIDAIDGLLSQTLLESIDGEGDSDWPSSPPLQHVNVSSIVSDSQQGHVAMLTGATSNGHWSMCVGARDQAGFPKVSSAEVALQFDVACRAACAPKFLGSTYRVLAGSVAISDRINCAFVPADRPGCVLMPHDAQVIVDRNRSPSPILLCQATETQLTDWPATIRWHYAIRCSSGGPLRLAAKKGRS